MEEEVDLREYVYVLIRRRRWIAGWVILPTLVALAVSMLLPKKYSASAIVAATEPRYTLKFDPRIESVAPQVDTDAYLGLATCDEIIAELFQSRQVVPLINGIENAEELFDMLDASIGEDESLVVLEVTDTDAERAASVANVWAELYVDFISEIYGQTQENQSFFQMQLVEADERLKRAEDDFIAYQAVNSNLMLEDNLTSKLNALAGHLHAEQSLAMLTTDAKSLRTRISLRKPGAEPNLADDLAALTLELNSLSRSSVPRFSVPRTQSFGSEANVVLMESSGNMLPFQLQLPGGAVGLTGKTASEQVAYLDELIGVLDGKSTELRRAAKTLKPEVLSLQEKLAAARTKTVRLQNERDLAREAYNSVARKSEEVRIAAASESSAMRLASRASVPVKHISPRRRRIVTLAGILGLAVGVITAFLWDGWKKAPQEKKP